MQGLRTLVLATKVLDEAEYQEWNGHYSLAASSLEDREARIAAEAEKIERGLELVGVTAIEDKLQEGVPQAINSLILANIKVFEPPNGSPTHEGSARFTVCKALPHSWLLGRHCLGQVIQTMDGNIEHSLSFEPNCFAVLWLLIHTAHLVKVGRYIPGLLHLAYRPQRSELGFAIQVRDRGVPAGQLARRCG